MFANLKMSAKILGAITIVLSVTSGISFWIMQSRINRQEEEAFHDKLRQITGMASATRSWFAANIGIMVPKPGLQASRTGACSRGHANRGAIRQQRGYEVPNALSASEKPEEPRHRLRTPGTRGFREGPLPGRVFAAPHNRWARSDALRSTGKSCAGLFAVSRRSRRRQGSLWLPEGRHEGR